MIIAFHFPGLRQLPHDMVEPAMRLMAIGLGGFHHGIDHCTGIGAGGCIAKEPGAASSDKGADRFLLSMKPLKVLVPRAGVEPAQPLGREILSLLRLPISPPGLSFVSPRLRPGCLSYQTQTFSGGINQ